MSQQKVDRYKEQKAKRKELVEKERRNRRISRTIAILILVLVVAGVGTGIGLTIRNQYIKHKNSLPNYSSSSLVVQDMAGILTEEEETDGAGEPEGVADGTEAAEETKAAETEAESKSN